jgi:L-lactate dehydrogenase (cytochrome)
MSNRAAASPAGPAAPVQTVARVAAKPKPRLEQRYLALSDFEVAARRYLPSMLFGFIAGAAETNESLADNRAAFAEYRFVPNVLVDTGGRSQAVTLFGTQYAAPFGIAPMGASALMAYRGDIVLARAAQAAGIPAIMSASSLIRMEEVCKEAPATWFQAYLPGEDARIEALVDRVAAAGFKTFVLTVDLPIPGNRENNFRAGFSLPVKPSPRLMWQGISHPGWLLGTAFRTLARHGMPHFENMDAGRGPPILSRDLVRAVGRRDGLAWDHLRLIRARWKGPLVVKGILAAADAARAREAGADGIIVSNHGGRQLDGAIAPLRVLPEVAAAAGGMKVILDGGVRRGSDVLKALALGADFVLIGRPFLYAAAVEGDEGVARAVDILVAEIDRNIGLMGLCSLSELRPEMVRRIAG